MHTVTEKKKYSGNIKQNKNTITLSISKHETNIVRPTVGFNNSVLFAHTVQAQNKLSDKEVKDGWQLLFDGKTTAGWRDAYKDSLPKGSWKIENGNLHVLPKKEGDTITRGDILSQKFYGNFELVAEFKLTEGTNSGIKYFVDNRTLGLEYQIIDDIRHPDAKQGKNGNRTLASLYDLIPALSTKPVKPMGG